MFASRVCVTAQDGKSITICVPSEESIFAHTTLEQEVMLSLQQMGAKNPKIEDLDKMVEHIMDGPPADGIDTSFFDVSDSTMQSLGVGNMMLMPKQLEGANFDFKDYAIENALASAGDPAESVQDQGSSRATQQESANQEPKLPAPKSTPLDAGEIGAARHTAFLTVNGMIPNIKETVEAATHVINESAQDPDAPDTSNYKEMIDLLVHRRDLLKCVLESPSPETDSPANAGADNNRDTGGQQRKSAGPEGSESEQLP